MDPMFIWLKLDVSYWNPIIIVIILEVSWSEKISSSILIWHFSEVR